MQIHFSSRTRRRSKEKQDIRLETELTKAIKLYRENSCIIRANRKLRERALELLQEKKILLARLESKAQPSPHIPSWLVMIYLILASREKAFLCYSSVSLSGTGNRWFKALSINWVHCLRFLAMMCENWNVYWSWAIMGPVGNLLGSKNHQQKFFK